MNKSETTHLYCVPWEVPESTKPLHPTVINVVVVTARAVLKKESAIRIPSVLPKPEPIVVPPESLDDYKTFSIFIKTSSKVLELKQNAIFFADVMDEHKFLYDISCVWAALSGQTEITMVAVTLNNDLVMRLVKWDKVSEDVKAELIPPPSETEKRQSIESMQTLSSIERRHKAVEIFNEEASLDFNGPYFKKNNDEQVCCLTVWRRYSPLLLSLNSLLFTIDNQFCQIGRTIPVDEKIVAQICTQILEAHTVENSSE